MSNTNDSRPLTQRPAFWWKVTSLAAAAWVMLFASWATAQVNVRMNCPAGYKCLPQAEAGSCGDQFQPFDGALAPGAARGNCPAAAGAPQNCGGGGCKTCFANNNAMRMCIWVGGDGRCNGVGAACGAEYDGVCGNKKVGADGKQFCPCAKTKVTGAACIVVKCP